MWHKVLEGDHDKTFLLDGIRNGFRVTEESEKKPTYLFDSRLPFGSNVGPSHFHRLSQAIRRCMARKGMPDQQPPLGAQLTAEVLDYRASAFSDNTRKTYRIHLTSYLRFCGEMDIMPVPVNEQTVAQYAAYLARVSAVTAVLPLLGPMDPKAQVFPMKGSDFNKKLRLTTAVAGGNFSSHSFRRGGAAWALSCGVPGEIVKVMGDWKSNAVFSSLCFSNYYNEVAVGHNQHRIRPPVADQHILAFEICAANRYKLTKKYHKLKVQSDADPDNLRLKNTVAQAKIAADAEREDNDLEQKRNQGKKVLYGHTVQLRHLFTKKYVHVSTTKTSRTESNNMAVELQCENAKHAQFRIMPRYKVKAEGDVVQVDDQIVLESVKSIGQFLHVGQTLFGQQSVYHHSFELNLSVRQSGFTLYRKYKPTDDDENKIKVGDPMRFYHKEMEAYLVAEGLFDDELTEDVHLRLRPVDPNRPRTLFPSSSAVTFWQIELEDGPVSGGILKWEQQCRIVHMCTRRYLAVSTSGGVSLSTDNNDPSTVFRLHAVIRDSDDIAFEAYARIEHVLTGYWLHALADEYMKKQENGSDDDQSMRGLKYTTAQLKKVTAIQEKQYDDAFTLQFVDQELVDIFHYMAGMVPFIQKLVSDKKSGAVLNAKMAHDVIASLQEMEDFMVENSVPSKNRQKLMRNLRIVELLVSLLRVPYQGSPDQSHLTNIFVEAYNVLYTYLMGNSRKNELYIAKYIDFFLTQFEYKSGKIGLNAAHMVMELIRDNRKIVDRISHDHINKFVDLLQREKNYRYLELLSVLCVCDGVSIADNQTYITEAWLMRDNKNCVYLTDVGDKIGKSPGVVYVSTNNGKIWKELKTFAAATSEEDEGYMFLERQLELFGMLCHGQNEFAIKVITKQLDYLTWTEAFTCLCDNSLPDRLRAKYCELIITLFVDIGDNVSVVDRVKLSYTYDEIDTSEVRTLAFLNYLFALKAAYGCLNGRDKVDRSTSQTYQYFPALRDWISRFLGTNCDMTASQIGNNMLVEQVLRLVHYLVKYGFYYKSTDIKMLLEPLMSLLDGRNDKPYPNIASKEAKEVLGHFQRTGRFQKSQETKAIVDAKIQALEVLSLFFNFIFNLRMEKFMNMFKETHTQASLPNTSPPELGPMLGDTFILVENTSSCKTALRKLQGIFAETAFFGSYETTEILMDLSHYDYDEMVRKSMQLLNRYYSSHRTLFTRAVQAQVLTTDASVAVSEKLNHLLPALRRLSTAKLTNEQAEELGRILDQLIALCHLDGELEEQHNMNQSILYNHAVLEDAFVILSQNIDVKLLEQYGGLRKVFQKTFLLLRAMARGNLVVQGRLFDRLDMLLSKEGAAAELSECLTEVFTGNSNTCMKVMGHQVQKVMSLVAQHRENIPQFLDLLNAIVKVEELDLPLKRNQSFVMTYFMQYRADIATVIDRPEQERELILTGKESKELDYLISMVDLLATCAEGENRYIESICQTIFKIPELLKVLNHTSISSNLKRPFLRFFLWVYLNTAGGMIESGAGDLPHDPLLWKYVESLNKDLQRMATFVAANPAKTKQLLKRPPAKRRQTFLKLELNIFLPSRFSERASSQEEQMRGMLHYYFDAVMPFLQIFCRSYYQPDREAHAGEPIKLSALTLTFEKFMNAIAPLISMERQLKNLVISMTSLITATGAIPLEKMEEFHSKYGGGTGSQDVRSDVRKSYEDYYNMEEDINSKLNIFSNNMQKTYGGVNSVQTQIGYPSDADYSEMGGDEELPLGQEFQDHIKCFVCEKYRDTKQKFRMAEKLVKQLEISQSLQGLSEEEKIEQLELDIKCLQLMRGLIHNEIVKLPDEWELTPAASRRQLKLIESVQSALNSYGVVVSSLGHLNRPQDDLVRELLAFLAVLLFNGNWNVQESMLEFFTGTREETFFFAVKSRMQLSALAMREKRQLHAMHMAKVEENVAQAKALKKAMKDGTAGAGDMMAAAQFGSILSDIRKSRISMNKRNTKGSRVSMNRSSMLMPSAQRGSKVPSNRNSVIMVQPANMGSGIRGSTLLGVSGMQLNGSSLRMGDEKPPVKAASLRKSQKVSPAENVPDITLDEMDDEEIAELTAEAISSSTELEFKDDGYIELVLRVLGLMCDNQHKGLQDYLREQPDNIKSVNLVAETTRFLSILYGNVNGQSAPLIIQLFDTLVEFTSGNFHNQAIVFDNKVCEYVNHILRAGTFKGCSLEQTYSLKKAIVTLVRALCEENPPDTKGVETQTLSGEVLEYVDSEVLMATMVQAHRDFLSQKPVYVEVRTLVEDVGFAYHHMLCRKMDLHKTCTKQALLKTAGDEAAWEFFAERTLSIEILKDDVLQKIHFQVKDKNALREEIKDKFKYSVDRSSPSNKLRDFMAWSTDIIEDIKYQRRIHANPLARFFVQSKWWLNPCVLLVSLILCLIVMVTWKAQTSMSTVKPDLSGWSGAQESIYAFGGLHNILSLCIVISYFLSNHPTFPDRRDFKKFFLKFFPAKKESKGEEEDEDDPVQEKRESHLEVRFFSIITFYYLAFLACSILGTVFWGYFFSFHLLHVVLLNQLLQRVILAVTRNGVSLVLVGILGLAIIFMFALVAFAFFRAYLDSDNGRQCRTVYECFVTVMHHGFVEGMYTTFEQELNGLSFVTTISLAAFDLIFFILITTIGLNIIFGIIVDTFSELRDSKWQIDNDMKNNCFICSRESYDFEKEAAGFESHVKHEHNQWAYLFFFIHLDETRPNDYSALELHVHRLLKSNNQDFFPLNRALSLDAQEDSSERKLETLMSQVEYLVAKMKEEEADKEREKEKQRQQEWETKHKLATK
ncbi:inositol 1,4,5-trisphosphate-gated calcium channel ITPR3-like [Littorina saxatilis]|uniref:inositol 1,4,5-trisphosphate-gated calcium channel ITPR3-like n=1 Tax=Littorina saxatilis TaxID=31220 RepID=UPI0038B6A98E